MTAHPHEHGPWLEDARRILTLIESAGQQYATGDHPRDATRDQEAQPGECAWCPVCQALSAARRSAPDLLDRLADLASGLAATIRASQPDGDDAGVHTEFPAGPAAERGQAPARPAPPETVRIDITD